MDDALDADCEVLSAPGWNDEYAVERRGVAPNRFIDTLGPIGPR